ncbi:MAG: lipid A biosynthesis lauroyl acyltransferase [Gammaproteobacteria bacterium]|nr:lipid A biosynthesis lauroyl acyltransferase [Gammaproteobacteria bacterium]
MKNLPLRYRFLQFIIGVRDWIFGLIAFLSLKLVRLIPIKHAARIFEGFSRWLGPRIWRHKVVMDNLEIAYPEKSLEERQKLASDSWAQMGQTLLEYVYLDEIFDLHEENIDSERIEIIGAEQFLKLRDDGLPAVLFTGHIANFELLPMVAAKFGLQVKSLFRRPNNKFAASQVAESRRQLGENMIASGAGAAFQLITALERNEHVGVLVDQKFRRGIKVPFFGKDAPTNTLLAKLARRYNCPVHGARTIRLPNGRFRLEITEELELPRDKNGDVDVRGTTELVTNIIEEWVREYPEQWLWMHRRWG